MSYPLRDDTRARMATSYSFVAAGSIKNMSCFVRSSVSGVRSSLGSALMCEVVLEVVRGLAFEDGALGVPSAALGIGAGDCGGPSGGSLAGLLVGGVAALGDGTLAATASSEGGAGSLVDVAALGDGALAATASSEGGAGSLGDVAALGDGALAAATGAGALVLAGDVAALGAGALAAATALPEAGARSELGGTLAGARVRLPEIAGAAGAPLGAAFGGGGEGRLAYGLAVSLGKLFVALVGRTLGEGATLVDGRSDSFFSPSSVCSRFMLGTAARVFAAVQGEGHFAFFISGVSKSS